MATTILWISILVLLPILAIWHFSKPKGQRIREMRARGWTWKRVAAYWNCSPRTARRWSMA